jgi:hypothetical protein
MRMKKELIDTFQSIAIILIALGGLIGSISNLRGKK